MSFLEHLYGYLKANGGASNLTEVYSQFKDTSPYEIEAALMILRKKHAIEIDFDSKAILITGELIEVEKSNGVIQIVLTLPPFIKSNNGSLDTVEAIKKVLTSAKTFVGIVCPYLDPTVITLFREEFESIAKKGIRTSIITRFDPNDLKLVKSLMVVRQIFRNEGNSKFLDIRHFSKTLSTETGKHLLYSALHAKMYVADEDICYIGSANLTEHSLTTNFESGVLIQDKEIIAGYLQIYAKVLNDSKIILEQGSKL